MENSELRQTILDYLEEKGIEYEHMKHEPLNSTEEACEVVGHQPDESTKTLVLEGEAEKVAVTVPGDKEVDLDKVAELTETQGLELCSPDELEDENGVELGGVPPFGYGEDVKLVVSTELFDKENVYFCPGRKDETIKVSGEEFRRIMIDQDAELL